jgi:hypothetical protein
MISKSQKKMKPITEHALVLTPTDSAVTGVRVTNFCTLVKAQYMYVDTFSSESYLSYDTNANYSHFKRSTHEFDIAVSGHVFVILSRISF